MDDTRDIAIRTSTEVTQLRGDMTRVLSELEEVRTALAERRGAEQVARWLIGIASGTVAGSIGALLTKLSTAFMNTPLPK